MSSPNRVIDNVKCCACGGSLANGTMQFVCLPKWANWLFPVGVNPGFGLRGFAIAIVCGKCMHAKVEIKFAVEWDDGVLNVKYHPVEELEDFLNPAQMGVAS